MSVERGRKRWSILIVDDEFGMAEMLRDVLSEYGYEVRLAINGQRALTALEECPADLVLTDVMMPVMSGPELARALRADERFQHIPIIFMTSLTSAVPRGEPLYDAVLEKPFTPDRLLAVLVDAFSRMEA
jgi:CheY-like chemotaxis protein